MEDSGGQSGCEYECAQCTECANDNGWMPSAQACTGGGGADLDPAPSPDPEPNPKLNPDPEATVGDHSPIKHLHSPLRIRIRRKHDRAKASGPVIRP